MQWTAETLDYLQRLGRIDDPVLLEMEARAGRDGFPIIGPVVGPWLYFFTRLLAARRVFEMGSGYGYSTWYFARALKDNGGGTVTHTVWDADLSQEAREWMERAGLLTCCDFLVSESILALSDAQPGIDLIFLDIEKEDYVAALSVIEEKLRAGGLLLVDNVLWHGRLVDETDQAPSTLAIREFNNYLSRSHSWDYLINPLRDGLGVARKR